MSFAAEQLVVEIFVRDIERSLAFYRQLGFALARRDDHFAELVWEDHLLFLEELPELTPLPSFPQANLRIMVADVERYWQLAATMGVRVVKPIDDRYYGLRDFTIADPDGFGVRFASPLADRHAKR
jgi:catechol 2,3-dioxygenase-like lactoylglutathione lyase family enzyme